MPGPPRGDRRDRGVCSPRGPILSEIEAGGPRKGGGSRAPQWKTGQPHLASAGDRKYRDKSSPSPFYSLHPGIPRNLGQNIRDPSHRVAAPTFPRAKLSAGPEEGCSGERGSAEVARGGEGRGAQSRDGGVKGTDWGRCPRRPVPAGKSALPRPRSNRKARPLPPRFKSSRVHDAPVPNEETESDPSPNRKE